MHTETWIVVYDHEQNDFFYEHSGKSGVTTQAFDHGK